MFIQCVYFIFFLFFFSLSENNSPPLFPFAVMIRGHFDGIASTFTRELIRMDGRNVQNRISLIWCTSHGTASAPRLYDQGMCFPSIHSEWFSIYNRHNVIYLPAASAWITYGGNSMVAGKPALCSAMIFLQLNDSISSLHIVALIYNSYFFAKFFYHEIAPALFYKIVWCNEQNSLTFY